MISKSSSSPETRIFMLQEYTKLFLIGKNVLIAMVPILTNKDVFESSYNDLKFIELLLQQSNQKRKMKNFKVPNLLRKNLQIIFRFC